MKVKKLFSLALCAAMVCCMGFSACGEGDKGDESDKSDDPAQPAQPVQLAAPIVSLNGNVISWNAVENATGYEVYLAENSVASLAETSYTISQTEAGSYVYTVYATCSDATKYTKSEASAPITYRVKEEIVSVPLAADKKIYVVGDSTVCDYSAKPDNYYLPRYGYGTQLYNYFNLSSPSQVVNLAISGRSSLSFLSEANYNTLKSSIGEGDYLIIGFGHNDEKSDDKERFTDPAADYQTERTAKGPSFAYTIYQNYVKLAKDKGATPVLCTPIVRYSEGGEYDGKSAAHVTADGDYAAALVKLGADTATAVVDLTSITKEYYSAHNDEAQYFHAFTTYAGEKPAETPDGRDNTHINKYGAKTIAYWFAENLPADCPLAAHVKIADAPNKEIDYPDALNAQYVKPNYKGFDPAKSTKLATISGADWYKTAMGVLGGNKAGNYKFSVANDKVTITADTGSKFASSQDGFGAAFVQINEDKNFKATVKATVTQTPATLNDQVAFGLMLRDDIYIDVNDATVASNFVSASVTGGGKANMSRTEKTALSFGGNIAFAKNVVYELSLERVGQVVTVTVKQGANAVTSKFTDISFVGIDNTKVYLCLFANRGLIAEFSDITFEITGISQGA